MAERINNLRELSERQNRINTLEEGLKKSIFDTFIDLTYKGVFFETPWFNEAGLYMPVLDCPNGYQKIAEDVKRYSWDSARGSFVLMDDNKTIITINFVTHSLTKQIIDEKQINIYLKERSFCKDVEYSVKVFDKEYSFTKKIDAKELLNKALSKPIILNDNLGLIRTELDAQEEYVKKLSKIVGKDYLKEIVPIYDQKKNEKYQISDEFSSKIEYKRTDRYSSDKVYYENDDLMVKVIVPVSRVNVKVKVWNIEKTYIMSFEWFECAKKMPKETTCLKLLNKFEKTE